ncbi:hypothetical protein GCM10011345_16270 [Gemmobacter megaterium]|nr:hypothetical protein [Gemmobacter megaterium]GGE11057.1 hypothetical protein GCM10011345_16270 [Gemmobacter megaterium]
MLEEVGQRPGGNPSAAFPFPLVRVHESRFTSTMTIHTSVPQDGLSRNEAAEALELFDLASTILRKLLDEAQAEASAQTARELATYTKDVSGALKVLVTERQNVEKLRRDAGELAGGREFDLDAARDEIGRRLACLRDAGPD